MEDYQPIDLRSLCNAGVALYGDKTQPPVGRVALHGLPFVIGGEAPDPQRCLISLAAAEVPVSVPIGAAARHVLFAHALLDSHILEGEAVGSVVATYVVRYVDGETQRIPVRE